jgi:hypothetical protein
MFNFFLFEGIIAFHARTSAAIQNVARNAVVVFGTVTLNTAEAYNARTGKFTAPEDGVYSFTWTIATYAGKYFATDIVHNGKMISYNHVNGGSYNKNFETASASAIIKMKKNDQVWIRTQDSGKDTYAYKDRCSFSGFRL